MAQRDYGIANPAINPGGQLTSDANGVVRLGGIVLNAFGITPATGAWVKVPSIFRLRITGTGSLTMDSMDSLGNITAGTFPTTAYVGETDKIEFPYAGDDAIAVRFTLTGTLAVEVI